MRPGEHEPLVTYHRRLRRSPQDFSSQIAASERVRIAMFAADNALAEYRALGEVEKWAARNSYGSTEAERARGEHLVSIRPPPNPLPERREF
jgi:hypothetical protein